MKWNPYEEFKQEQVPLPIVEPPCRACTFFRPVRKYDRRGNYDGLILCHADSQFGDFSCYRPRDEDVK